jgi:maleate isomerase
LDEFRNGDMSIKARLGVIVPSVNVVIEDDLRRWTPPDVGFHVARVSLNTSSEEALRRVADQAPEAAARLRDAGVGAVALACTGAAMMGSGGRGGILERIAVAAGVPATTTTAALLDAFAALAVRRVALCSPFEDWFNEKEAAFLEQAGMTVVRMAGLGIRDPRDCAVIPPDELVRLGRSIDSDEVEAVFLSCANVRGFEAVAPLEDAIGKPVVTSNQVVLWALLRLAGASARPTGAGRLFAC